MESYNRDDRKCLASVGDGGKVSDNNQSIGAISSEPLDRYINDLKSHLRNELKSISCIRWE